MYVKHNNLNMICYTKSTMAKQKKKRNKQYTGQDAAAPVEPTVRRYTAIDRGRVGQWWFEKKKIVKFSSITLLITIVFAWLIIEAIRIFT